MEHKRTIHDYSEAELEDWLWDNVHMIDFVDRWIDRQMILDNRTRLDLLGFKKNGPANCLILVELKARSLKTKDIIQVKKYESHLIDTINSIGLIPLNIWTYLIGVGCKRIDSEVVDVGIASSVGIYTLDFSIDYHSKGEIKLYQWQTSMPSVINKRDRAIRLMKGGHYDNLIEFMLPQMPDFIRKEYRFNGGNNG